MNRRRAPLFGVALLFVLGAFAACGGSHSPTPTLSSAPSQTIIASPTSSPSPSPPTTAPESPRDLLDLARRFRGYPRDGPRVARTTPFDYQIGDAATFKLIGLDENAQPYDTHATLRAISEHAYFFVADDAPYAQSDLDQITSDFETIVWPKVTGAFGEPWTPGVDGDPRITILHARLQGAAGYVSGEDEYPAAAVPLSNQREMLYIDQGALAAPGPAYNALVGHELQHLIHFNGDASEDSWVNEGLSEVAWEIAGGAPDVQAFLDRPDTQLNFWPYLEDGGVHYAESELFFGYLLDHYGGRENASRLVAEQGNGINGVNVYLAQYNKTFDDVFADFVVANFLDATSGPYSHANFNGTTSAVAEAEAATGGDTVSQYGADYLHIPPGSGELFQFQGSSDVTIGIPPIDGAFWWSGRMDGMDSRLTRAIDLTSASSAILSFDEWYDTEPGWDYAYVAVSTDDGDTWKTLPGQHTTSDNPLGQSYGNGYTGDSNGWVREQVDLSAYAGRKVLLRFETVNDDGVNLTGFAVDNVSIPEIGLSDSADSARGWTVEGFQRITAPLPQKFIVQLIRADGTVSRVPVNTDNTATVLLGDAEAIIAISAATPNTTEAASYTWTIERSS